MQLTKHHGLGNDFLVALEEVNGPIHGDATIARALCDRRRGLGADGFIVMPLPCEGTTAEQTLVALGKDVWPKVKP